MPPAEPTPLFSVLIPTTGRSELIGMAIQSVRQGTLADFEIVVADSSGAPETRAAALKAGDKRIRYVFASPAAGPFAPWDVAAKAATGEYLLWLDDDNYLLPSALQRLADAIRASGADIVTANHLYYYDARHPRLHLRNSVGVIPFNGTGHSVDLCDALRQLFAFTKRGPGLLPRFHFSATAFARSVIEKAVARLGAVLFTDMPNMHSLQPILFAFATSCYFIDEPIVIVGRLGVSMSQVWSTAARARFAKTPFVPVLSPLTAYTRLNGILENYLRAQRALPERLGDLTIDYDRFAGLYLEELFLLDTGLKTAFRNWKNFFAFLETLAPRTRARLRPRALGYALLTLPLWCARRTGGHHLWRYGYGLVKRLKAARVSPAARLAGAEEFVIPLPAGYHIDSIAALARHVPELMRVTTSRDVSRSPRS